MTTRRALRLARGVVAAVFATFVALMSHLLGGGLMPGPLGIALPLVVAMPLCVLLLDRAVSLPRLAAAVGVSQFFFHTMFVLGSAGQVTGASAHSGHGASVGAATALEITVEPVHGAHGGSTMWLWHLVAALVTTLALHRASAGIARVIAQYLASWPVVALDPVAPPAPALHELVPHVGGPERLPEPRRRASQWRAPPVAVA